MNAPTDKHRYWWIALTGKQVQKLLACTHTRWLFYLTFWMPSSNELDIHDTGKLLSLSTRPLLIFFFCCLHHILYEMTWGANKPPYANTFYFHMEKKRASFWRQKHSFSPTHPYDLLLLLKCQHLVVSPGFFFFFFSYAANWNQPLVKLHSLAQLCENFYYRWELIYVITGTSIFYTDHCFSRQYFNEILYVARK